VAVTQHVSDGGADNTKRVVKAKNTMCETFHVGQDGLWPRSAVEAFFMTEPEAAGYKQVAYATPDGGTLVGFRMPYHRDQGPLPDGVILISKDFKVEVVRPGKYL